MRPLRSLLPFALLLLGTLGCLQSFAQKKLPAAELLQSGPMIGYSEMREVMLWVQTKSTCEVAFEYQAHDELGIAPIYKSEAVLTQKETGFTAHCLADQVLPGKDYDATLLINGKRIALPYKIQFHARDLWQYRSDPPAFKAIIGSCAYFNDSTYDRPGKPYGSDYEIFESIARDGGDLMLWLGDNIYLNEADWNTSTGIHYRYTHGRSYKQLQPLLAQMSHYAVWDDHDYGPNDADRSFIHKDLTLQAFKNFWAQQAYGLDGKTGITSMFSWSDCDFFLMDDRWFRSTDPNHLTNAEMLGEPQIEWLIEALRSSQATFKFVCIGSVVLSTADVFENYIHVAPTERQRLLDRIDQAQISGVIFLTGDRHHTEMSRYQSPGGYPMYDLTVSPFTSGTYPGDNGANTLLLPETEYVGHNYAALEVTGPRLDRTLHIAVKDKMGKVVWQKDISAKEMRQK